MMESSARAANLLEDNANEILSFQCSATHPSDEEMVNVVCAYPNEFCVGFRAIEVSPGVGSPE